MNRIQCIVAVLCLWTMGAGPGPSWYEPKAYTGEAIQQAIADAYKDIRGRVFLPGGTYKISKPILLDGLGPMIIEGASQGSIWRETDHASTVRLEWYGPKGQPMIHLNSLGVQIRNVAIDGRDIATWGVLLTNQPRSGAGLNRLEDVTLAHFTKACFQAGEKPEDGCCADMYFDRVTFAAAPEGYVSINDQSVNNYFVGCQFGYLGIALNIDRGGAVSVMNCSASASDLLLKVRRGGGNAGGVHVGPMKIERSGYKHKYMSLLDVRADPDGNNAGVDCGQVRLVSIRMADGTYPADVKDDVETPIFRLGPGAQVVAESCLFKAAGDRGQWPMGYVQGKKEIGVANFRATDTIWLCDLNSFVTNDFVHLEFVDPPDGNGRRASTFKRGTQ